MFVFKLVWWLIRALLWWWLPVTLLAVGYFFPTLQQPVGLPRGDLQWGLVTGSFILIVIWFIIQFVAVSGRYTSATELQIDDFVSLLAALAITFVAGFMAGQNNWAIKWYVINPWIGALADAALSGFLAINNAAQKPWGPEQNKPPRGER